MAVEKAGEGASAVYATLLAPGTPKETGSALHVMVALCCSSRQVVVPDKQLDSTNMGREFLGT